MESKLSLEIESKLSEHSFSIDELIIKTKILFEKEGMVGFLGLLIMLLDNRISPNWITILENYRKNQPTKNKKHYCCSKPKFVRCDRPEKTLITSIGKLVFKWTRMRCTNCDKTLIPLREFFGIDKYQRKSSELEKIVTEVISEQSYRRTSAHLETIGGIPVPRTTLHRWVMKSDCDEINPSKKRVETLIADGTGYKRRPPKDDPEDNRGEIKLVVGIAKDGTVIPYGAWADISWRKIGTTIKKGNHPNKKLKFVPVANILVSDGEEGLMKGLDPVVMQKQRCLWHVVHDLPASLRYKDEAPLDETRRTQKELATIIDIDLPEKDFEFVTMEDKLLLSTEIWKAEKGIEDLAASLRAKGYKKACNYLRNAKDSMFNYLRVWMKNGVVTPKVSSMVERMMREIGRRIKKIGFGWSEAGAAKMTRIIIKRITSADEWTEYWNKRLRILGAVELKFIGVSEC